MFRRLRKRTELGPRGGPLLPCLFCALALACSRSGLALSDGAAEEGALPSGGGPASDAASPSPNGETSPNNCGEYGHGCCGGTCIDGVCQRALLATQDAAALGIALDDGYLYWSGYDVHGTIERYPLAGGTPQTLLTNAAFPTRIAVEGANVYWSGGGSVGAAGNISGGIFKAPIAGGPVSTLASDMTAIHWSLAVRGAFVYWTSYDQGTVNRANLDGSGTLTLASGQQTPFEIAVDAEHVYWTTRGGTVMRASLDGSDPITFLSQRCGYGLVLDQTSLYCSGFGGLLRAPLDQSPPEILGKTADAQNGAALAIDAEYAYWALDDYEPQPILLRVPLAGGPSVTLAPAHENDAAFAVTISDHCVYWAQGGPSGRSTLFALAK